MKRNRPTLSKAHASMPRSASEVLSLPRVSPGITTQGIPAAIYADNTDESLMLRYCEGDFTAMEALVDRYHRRLHAFFSRVSHEADLIDDLIQDTFIRLMEQASHYHSSGRFSAYLFTIAANLFKDDRRRSYRRFR